MPFRVALCETQHIWVEGSCLHQAFAFFLALRQSCSAVPALSTV